MTLRKYCLSLLLLLAPAAARNTSTWASQPLSPYDLTSSVTAPSQCPPCFNCLLPAFTCGQYGECNEFDGQCKCPPGWGGIDCLRPQCDSLADGDHRRLREDGESCECKDGWGGINCNVCETDNACIGFPLLGAGEDSDGDNSSVSNMTCYKGGETVFNNHQMCDVTNRKIIDTVGADKPVQVTFSCDKPSSTCSFQFWVSQKESFYCGLNQCKSSRTPGYDFNTTAYECEELQCKCVPGRFICGENGSVDISDFLTEEIKGPAKFSCQSGQGCKFEEPAMNQLINDIFGDPYITLDCHGGECLHYSQVPGYQPPPAPDNRLWVALSISAVILVFLLTFALIWSCGRVSRGHELGQIRLPEHEAAKLMTDHVPASLHFSNITYDLGAQTILSGITGHAKPGQVMAIMGASGAGKTTLLDILARKTKRGHVEGDILVNGREVPTAEYRSVTGYVDQEDLLMSTLTVYETVLYSALLRLPREMSYAAKKFRTLETLNELGILKIKDSRIGDSSRRSISGGEKRRVSIACELVTSPSILFLDEPTSGLDAFNAFNVVESLVNLARNYKRTVIFTIHQPRSNIVSLFDQLLVLGAGRTVYSGDLSKCHDYFGSIGRPCPPGFNIADYLIDLTMYDGTTSSSPNDSVTALDTASPSTTTNMGEEEQGLIAGATSSTIALPLSVRSNTSSPPDEEETELRARRASIGSATGAYLKRKTSQIYDAVTANTQRVGRAPMTANLISLTSAYADSDIAKDIRNEIEETRVGGASEARRDVVEETVMMRGRKRATWGTQFTILSGRAFKNLYRDPALLAAHYISAIVLALICGFFFHNLTNDIPGFQNRLGLFFFTLALFGFSCLSSLGLFANERVLFMRERSNGYYSTFTYFTSKILFDILPLRLIPPLIYGSIVYGLAGLVPTVPGLWKFMLILVLFNLATASLVLWLSVIFASVSVASLVGTLIMLYNLLFTGLLINPDTVTPALQFLHTLSFFHAAFEAMAVNELRYLHLREHKYGVDLDVPAATILSTFGLHVQSFWWPDTSLLAIFFGVFTLGSFLTLHFFVKEKR